MDNGVARILGAPANGGVSRPFLILGEGGLDPSTRSLLEHSTGPRLGINIANRDPPVSNQT